MRHGEVKQVLREPGASFTGDPFNPEKPLPEHVQRMAVETQTVVTNLRKLSEFTKGQVFPTLPQLEQMLMFDQLEQMTAYAKTLSLRYCMALLDHG
jgi:hypothetical protein